MALHKRIIMLLIGGLVFSFYCYANPLHELNYISKSKNKNELKKSIDMSYNSKNSLFTKVDTLSPPYFDTVDTDHPKLIMSAGDKTIEFSPASLLIRGALIEPLDKRSKAGISTSFYLRDTSSWSFYTDAKSRFTINGNGDISTSSALLINNATNDGVNALRVNGQARFDSSIIIRASSDDISFISLCRSVKSITEPDDETSPYTSTPTGWAMNNNTPVLRIRHPRSVTNKIGINTSIARDFLILPYQYGMAIEYNGVVECWVGEWSIHRGLSYNDVEGKGNGWGAVLWVGDDNDRGGVRTIARNNAFTGGNIAYGEISVEKFGGSPNGDLRLRLPSTENQFHFIYGERGSENIIAKMKNDGLVIPKISSVSGAGTPEKAQIVFDSTDNHFKGFNGADWVNFESSVIKTGSAITTSNGTEIVYTITHGLTAIPSYFNVIATSENAANISYITANNTQLLIHYANPPVAGENNLSWTWQVKK